MQLRALLLVALSVGAAFSNVSAKKGSRRRRSPKPPPKPPHPTKGCTSTADCSGNGVCASATACRCDPAWAGDKCQILHLVPGSVASGLRQINVPATAPAPPGGVYNTIPGNTSTWGGATVYDEATKTWFMWATELADHCGMHTWTTNSQTIRWA
eukprot:SAG11_NODE_2506_length_3275_cov_2.399559_1_plen_155_part_00